MKSIQSERKQRTPVTFKASSRKPIRVLIVDDHPVVRAGIRASLRRDERMVLVGEAGSGEEAARVAGENRVDVILMDVSLPDMSGHAAAARIRSAAPSAKVVFLTMSGDRASIQRAIESGAAGYVLKSTAPTEIVRAIHAAQAGGVYFSEGVQRALRDSDAAREGALTPREGEVLARIAAGLSNKGIASKLGIGVRTVETHREHIMEKLGIHNVAGLTRFAIERGLIANP
ncbi:MAG TPA: response regulator transcription factor [Planctomycetota bacterium]|nr:response regulator transcription factor [Planctomycetota bacterium]